MTSAAKIAQSAHEQALAAIAERERQRAAEEAERERLARERHAKAAADAIAVLGEWFPGVTWEWDAMGDYGHDTVLWDASESWPPSFLLKAERRKYGIEILVGDYRPDTSMPGYKYFSGGVVRSAADVGRYLAGKTVDTVRPTQ